MTVSGANRWTDRLSESLDLLQTNGRTDGLTENVSYDTSTSETFVTGACVRPMDGFQAGTAALRASFEPHAESCEYEECVTDETLRWVEGLT